VRALLTLCLAIGLLPIVQAQDQERSLVDRLLRPDMRLQNNAQNKKFLADGAPTDKRATVAAFYVHEKPKPTRFAEARDFSTDRFASQSFHDGSRANVSSPKQAASATTAYPTSSMSKLRSAPDSNKNTGERTFAGQRPFLDRGKSQKSLSRQNPPMTIEQVRELLNKNK
jgi:hypothetical protein